MSVARPERDATPCVRAWAGGETEGAWRDFLARLDQRSTRCRTPQRPPLPPQIRLGGAVSDLTKKLGVASDSAVSPVATAVPDHDPASASPHGDGQQLQEFIHRLTANQSRIRAYITSLMPGSPDIHDVLQETNLTLWKSRARYRVGTNFVAWAFAVARFQVRTHAKHRRRKRQVTLSPELLDLLAAEAPVDEDDDRYLKALESCQAKLSAEERELIEARYRPGRSLHSLAEKQQRKPAALRVALMRIRLALRDCIERTLRGNSP